MNNDEEAKKIAKYIEENGKLPDSYIMKEEAERLGWNPREGNLADVAPGKSIGGDSYKNREGNLPVSEGREWREADLAYIEGPRNANRLLYSSDGLYYSTNDHYANFEKVMERENVQSQDGVETSSIKKELLQEEGESKTIDEAQRLQDRKEKLLQQRPKDPAPVTEEEQIETKSRNR